MGDAVVRQQLLSAAEAFAALWTRVLFVGEVGAQVVLHGQLVGVGVAADGAAVLARLVGVPVVDKAAGVAVCAAALVAGERPLVGFALCLLHLEAMLLLLRVAPTQLQLLAAVGNGWLLLFLQPGAVHLHQSLDLSVELLDFGLVLFVPP